MLRTSIILAILTSVASDCPLVQDGTNFKVVKSQMGLLDAVRSRTIQAVVWRPDADGPFPLVTVNHGAGMAADDPVVGGYGYLAEALAQRGYVVAAWNEYTLIGRQWDYILDSAAIRDSMYNASADASHVLHNLLCDKAVAVGHSLGGGAEFVAADIKVMKTCGDQKPCNGGYTADFQGLAALSGGFKWSEKGIVDPYETAQRLTIPALFVSGTRDCMVKPMQENYPFYKDMTHSTCRIFTNVTGADHCQWAGLKPVALGSCVVLEKLKGCAPQLSATAQQDYALKYVYPFFEYVTRGNDVALSGLFKTLNDDSQSGSVIHEHSGCGLAVVV